VTERPEDENSLSKALGDRPVPDETEEEAVGLLEADLDHDPDLADYDPRLADGRIRRGYDGQADWELIYGVVRLRYRRVS